jgi:hypothetical protein
MTVDTKTTGSVTDGTSQLEGVTRSADDLGGVPAITVQPQVGSPIAELTGMGLREAKQTVDSL